MTKKDKILKLFNEKEWVGNVKYILKEDLSNAGLSHSVEYGERYNDIHYLKRILKKDGYTITIGSCCVYVNK